ncbi:dioxygenase [Hypoxylon trugodes]|uniref:dioxygenase n=1 Tax=Hypoxylon trugodes TaxID=326681 RepID=UPI00219A6849|nr:dioxygenase [Hypoxylon trugodes]KAI1392026.1 dioxygenase [Hypoxylon trugodes]
MGSAPPQLPSIEGLTLENITETTKLINSQCPNPRLRYIMERLVQHVHDFARETRLSSEEWMIGLNFLVQTGQISSDVRHEFILLSDTLGLSMLVDGINHPKPPNSTEGSLLGPFHTHDAPTLDIGANMSNDPQGEPLLCICTVKDTKGNPVPGVKIDIWETDSSGHYDVQHADRDGPSERCVMISDEKGRFWFKGIRPVSYPIPHDGPVGKLLEKMGRHCWRPAHLHFIFQKDGWDNLVTALYVRGDKYEKSDAVFGAKEALTIDFTTADAAIAKEYDYPEGGLLLVQDFILTTQAQTDKLRDDLAVKAIKQLGLNLKLVDHLPVPDVD